MHPACVPATAADTPAARTCRCRDALASRFDPRTHSAPYGWFRVVPRRVLTWREVDELLGRELMSQGRWLV